MPRAAGYEATNIRAQKVQERQNWRRPGEGASGT